MEIPHLILDPNNPFSPLPADYDTLTPSGQKEARLWVLRKQDTPEDFVRAWYFFRTVYLAQSQEVAFYKDGMCSSPPFHYEMISDVATFGRNAFAAPRGFAKCLNSLSRVLGIDGSWKSVKDIEEGDLVAALTFEGKHTWSKVIAKAHTGSKPLLKITTKQGHEIEVTEEHRVLCDKKWVEAGDLRIGQKLAASRGIRGGNCANYGLDQYKAELLGVLTGDGATTQSCNLTLFENELLDFVTLVCLQNKWNLVLRDLSRGLYSITNGGVSFIRNNGLLGHKSTEKRIPETIWTSSDASLASFLRGLFDTDGTVNKKSGSVNITLANKELIRDVQLALLRLGIRSRYKYRKAGYAGCGKQFDSWGLNISSAKDRIKFRDTIGFRIQRKMDLLRDIDPNQHDATDTIPLTYEEKKRWYSVSMWDLRKKYGVRAGNHYDVTRPKLKMIADICDSQFLRELATSDVYWDPIVSIEEVEPADTYDIQVEGNANFLCEGLYVHNSNVIGLEVPLLLAITRPNFSQILCLATDKLVEERFGTMIPQLAQNELLLADIGNLIPPRGKGAFNHHRMVLTNGSVIQGLSVMGKKRGGRPNLFTLDDPENDPDSDSETSRAQVMAKFETVLWKQVIPMLKFGACVNWIGTLIDRKSFLYQATCGDDPRFDFWNRRVYKALAIDPNNPKKVHLLWPSQWPLDVLEARKEEIGPGPFASEYLNEPVSEQDRSLPIDPRKNEYSVEGVMDPHNPLNFDGKVSWCERVFDDSGHRTYDEKSMIYRDLVRPMFRVMTFDYASGLTASNDYSCIAILGFDRDMTLWVLDMWMGRAKDEALYRLIYEMGCIWRPRVVGIEAVSVQKAFAEAAADYIAEGQAQAENPWRPRVYPITYSAKESKGQRINSALSWRFDSGRIKYPAHRADDWPFSQLYAQTNDFTPDLALLIHDDAIDTVAMSAKVVKGKGAHLRRERGTSGLLERIKKNEPIAKGIPLLSGVPLNQVTDEMLDILSNRRKEALKRTPPRRHPDRPPSRILRRK